MAKVLEKNGKRALDTFTQDVIQGGVDKRHETPAQARQLPEGHEGHVRLGEAYAARCG